MAVTPPRIDQFSPAKAQSFTTFTADIDLTAQSGYPTHAAQRLVIVNLTAGTLIANVTDFSGATYDIHVGAGETVVEDNAIVQINDETADTITQIRAYRWAGGTYRLNA